MKKIEYQIPATKVVKLNSKSSILVGSYGEETGGGDLGGED